MADKPQRDTLREFAERLSRNALVADILGRRRADEFNLRSPDDDAQPRARPDPSTKSDVPKRHDLAVFLGIVAVLAVPFIFALQANGVEIGWWLSALVYLACIAVFTLAFFRWEDPYKWKAITRIGVVGIIMLALAIVSVIGVTKQYQKEHQTPWNLRLQYANLDLDGQTIITGGRIDVLNGLVVPPVQLSTDKKTDRLSVRLYLSEGDARWSGPWEPALSDERGFPHAFHWGGPEVNPHETWTIPDLVVQRNKGIPFSNTVSARLKVFYGDTEPAVADFMLQNAP